MKLIHIIFSLLLLVTLFSITGAQNLTTSVQGVLRDAVGHSVSDGQYTLLFKLYTVDNGGTALWTETQENVEVTHGVFSVELGAVASLPTINAGQVYYLGISAQGGAELQPRIKLHNAFAANVTAAMAGYTNNVPSSGLATLDSIKFSDNTRLTTADPNKLGIPIGGIIMWSGNAINVPSNWKICDGTNGTPNLTDRFIVGAGSSYAIGDTGGLSSNTLTVAQLPAHSHTGTTSTNGSHTHGSNSTDRLGFAARVHNSTPDGLDNTGDEISAFITTKLQIYEDGDHNHTFTTDNTGSGNSIENRPPYFALYYIMKISN